MDQIPGEGIVLEQRAHPLVRAIRVALVVYLSPLLLVVLAIGLIGSLAARLKPAPAREGAAIARPIHKLSRPMGLAETTKRSKQIL